MGHQGEEQEGCENSSKKCGRVLICLVALPGCRGENSAQDGQVPLAFLLHMAAFLVCPPVSSLSFQPLKILTFCLQI